ncbi:MAG: ABC-type transport auxiliary lipoprotein family protein [Caulobacterales bacterium]
MINDRFGLLRLTAVAVLAAALGGCVTIFPKEPPEQLYRFGPEPETAAAAPATQRITVTSDRLGFNRAADTDRILTSSGDQVAYIAGGRWATPASLMFQGALQQAFDASPGPVRLAARGDVQKADYSLRLNVVVFEARYEAGDKAAPTVFIEVRGTILRNTDRTVVGEQEFRATAAASDNRVGAIAQAFNAATGQILGQIVTWTDQTAA